MQTSCWATGETVCPFIIFHHSQKERWNTMSDITGDLKLITAKSYVFHTEGLMILFYVHGSVHHESMSIIVQQYATIYNLLYFCERLYMFQVVPSPIIGSTPWSSNSSLIAEGCRNGLTHARCCNYSYICSWWWVEVPPETCRAFYRNIINCI